MSKNLHNYDSNTCLAIAVFLPEISSFIISYWKWILHTIMEANKCDLYRSLWRLVWPMWLCQQIKQKKDLFVKWKGNIIVYVFQTIEWNKALAYLWLVGQNNENVSPKSEKCQENESKIRKYVRKMKERFP